METLDDLFSRLDQLNDIGASLSSERNQERLLEKILLAAKAITRADGGTLYLLSEDGQHLHFEIVRTDSLQIAFGGSAALPASGNFPDLPLYGTDGVANDSMVAAYAAITGKTVNIADAYTVEGFDFSGSRRFDERTGYRLQSFLTVSMKNHEGELIGVLQLINAVSPQIGQTVVFSEVDQHLAESLASLAAISLTNRQLIQDQEVLFESFIKLINLINLAIDEKSPYTGGHFQRVLELTMLQAEAADATTEGPLADFKLTDEDRYELRIATLLHDCGKVTAQVHVVDKATKLQTICGPIHLIDTRFEVIKRDAEVRKWHSIAEGKDAGEAEVNYRGFCQKCDVDRSFLRQANIGSEKMSDADLARVQSIARQYRWCDVGGKAAPFLSDDELESLSIGSGTLTQSECETISHHIVATIKMLEELPCPKHLKNVPEYAGGHHERMDGKGYPRGLKREEMSWQARIMGIADIFEALTAKGRQYKEGMKLSQALKILENFKKGGYIDRDLHEVFARGEVFRKYAESYLGERQLDC